MLRLSTVNKETMAISVLAQDYIEHNTIIDILLKLLAQYEYEQRFTKKLCTNYNLLTWFGLRNININQYNKIPLIKIDITKDIIPGLRISAYNYILVKKEDYVHTASKYFKLAIKDCISTLNYINCKYHCIKDLTYDIKHLKELLDDNVVLFNS